MQHIENARLDKTNMSKAKFPNTTRRRLSSVVIINSSNKNKVDNNIRNNDKAIRAIRIVMIAMIMKLPFKIRV